MKNESDFKSAFCKSIRSAKGYATKLAAPMISGIPDIYAIMPGYMPVLLEAKWFGEITSYSFNRKIKYSALQVDWLNETNKVQNFSSFGLMGLKYEGHIYCVLTPFHVTHISHEFKRRFPYCVLDKKMFDVKELFLYSQVPLMQIQPLHRLTPHNVPVNINNGATPP